jgi:hypothetical protein
MSVASPARPSGYWLTNPGKEHVVPAFATPREVFSSLRFVYRSCILACLAVWVSVELRVKGKLGRVSRQILYRLVAYFDMRQVEMHLPTWKKEWRLDRE